MITAVAEDARRKGINPVSADVVVDGGQADNIKPASAKLTSPTFAVTLAWGDNGPPRSWNSPVEYVRAAGCGEGRREIGRANGMRRSRAVGTQRGFTTWWRGPRGRLLVGVSNRLAGSVGTRPCNPGACGDIKAIVRRVDIADDGWANRRCSAVRGRNASG